MDQTCSVIGWDIGGANIKAVRLDRLAGAPDAWRGQSVAFEMWRAHQELPQALAGLGECLDAGRVQAHALTMTAELADCFATKGQGVRFICGAVQRAFPGAVVRVLDLDGGGWAPVAAASDRPMAFAANNWMASALYVAARHPDALFMDMGSTTTDIIPIRGGRVLARGRTDTARLLRGELVYTGVLRTNPNTLADTVPVNGAPCPVAAENFSLMADVYLLLGRISPQEYSCPTPDARGKTPEEARARLARLVCADSESLGASQIENMARYLGQRQMQRILRGAQQVLSAQGEWKPPHLVCAGSGSFLIRGTGRLLGLETQDALTGEALGAGQLLPALAAAWLLAGQMAGAS